MYNFQSTNSYLAAIPTCLGGVSDCLLRSYTVCNAFLRIGSADHKTHMVLTNDFTEASTELTHEKMSLFFLKQTMALSIHSQNVLCPLHG